MRGQFGLEEIQVSAFGFRIELLAPDGLFEHIHQVNGVGGDFFRVVVEGFRQDLEGKAGGNTVHALVDTGRVTILLQRFRLGIGILQHFTVINTQFGIKRRIFVLVQSCQDAESCQQRQGFGGT